MLAWMKTKVATLLIGALAAGTVAGGTAVAASRHAGPFAPGAVFGSQKTVASDHDQHDANYETQGLIKGVTFTDSGKTSGALVLLPDGQTATVKVTFTAATHVEVNGAQNTGEKESGDQASGKGTPAPAEGAGAKTPEPEASGTKTPDAAHSAAALAVGLYANVTGTKQADGSVLAKNIQANANGKAHQGDDAGQGADHDLTGVITAVNATAHTFVFVADGQTQAVTIAFDNATKIEDHGNGHSIAAGTHAHVHATKRADGTLYATAIEVQSSQAVGTPGPGEHGHAAGTLAPNPEH
jgi:hypothetical protein